MSEPRQAPPSRPDAAEEGRKPYQKPGIAWEEPLEVRPALMAACAKASLQSAECDANPGS